MGLWLLRLSAKILALLRLLVNIFQLRLTKKLKINFFCFKELNINKPVFFVSLKQNKGLRIISGWNTIFFWKILTFDRSSPHYSARLMRFGSRGQSEIFFSDTPPKCLERDCVGRRLTGARHGNVYRSVREKQGIAVYRQRVLQTVTYLCVLFH